MMFGKRRKTERRYTRAEVDVMLKTAVEATGERFARILARTAARMSKADRARLAEEWDYECSQSAARHEADSQPKRGFSKGFGRGFN